MMQSTSYSTPATTTPRSVIASTPAPSVSIRRVPGYGSSPDIRGGMGLVGLVRRATANLFALPPTRRDEVLMEFPGGKASVLSGLMTAPELIDHRPAIIDEPVGQGRILMFATNPIYRNQTFGEYRMLYNALWSWRELGLGTEIAAPAAPSP